MTLAVAVVLFALIASMLRGRVGRALITIRDDEIVARSMGVNLALYKTRAFAISAAYAGMGGALYVFTVGFVVARVVHGHAVDRRSWRRWSSAVWPRSRARCWARCSSCSCRSTPPTWTRRWPGSSTARSLIVFMYVERGGLVGIARRIGRASGSIWQTHGTTTGGGARHMQRSRAMLLLALLATALALVAAGLRTR